MGTALNELHAGRPHPGKREVFRWSGTLTNTAVYAPYVFLSVCLWAGVGIPKEGLETNYPGVNLLSRVGAGAEGFLAGSR